MRAAAPSQPLAYAPPQATPTPRQAAMRPGTPAIRRRSTGHPARPGLDLQRPQNRRLAPTAALLPMDELHRLEMGTETFLRSTLGAAAFGALSGLVMGRHESRIGRLQSMLQESRGAATWGLALGACSASLIVGGMDRIDATVTTVSGLALALVVRRLMNTPQR